MPNLNFSWFNVQNPMELNGSRRDITTPAGLSRSSRFFLENREYHLKIAPGDHLKTWKTWINLLEII
jgi:hypothetical protein